MLAGQTQAAAAASAGVAAETVSRWKRNDAAFVAALNRRRQDLWADHHAELLALAAEARGALRSLLKKETDPALRFKVAKEILDRMPAVGTEAPVTAKDVEQQWRSEEAFKALTMFG